MELESIDDEDLNAKKSKVYMVDSNQNTPSSVGGEIATHGILVDIVTQTVAKAQKHLDIKRARVVLPNGDESWVKDYGCCILPTINTLTP